MRRRSIGITIAALLILLIGAITLWVATFDLSGAVRDVVLQRVEATTGRDLSISKLTVTPSFTPTVVAYDISLANAPWSESPGMIVAEKLEVQLQLLPLLRDDAIMVDRLVLSGADVLIERAEDGTGNWQFEPKIPENAPEAPEEVTRRAAPLLTDIRIENSRLRWEDHVIGRSEEMWVQHTMWTAATIDSPIFFQGAGAWHGYGFELAGEVGSMTALLEGTAPWPVDVSGHILDTTFDLAGFLGFAEAETDLGVSVVGEQLKSLGAILGADLPGIELYRFDARIATKASRSGAVTIDDLALQLADSTATGRLDVDLLASPLRVQGSLAAEHLDLPVLAAAFGVGAGSPDTDGPRPLPLDELDRIEVQLDLNASDIALGDYRLGPASAVLDIEDTRLALRNIEIHGGGGISSGAVVLAAVPAPNADAPTGELSLLLRSDGLDLGALLEAAGTTAVTEVDMDIEVSLDSTGRTVEDLLSKLKGDVSVVAENGQIRHSELDQLVRDFDFLQLVLPFWQHVGVVPLNCILGEMEIEDGIGKTAVLLDSQRMSVFGEGTIDLPNAELNMLLDPQPKSGALSTMGVPVRVSGSIRSPAITPDPGATLGRIVGGLVGGLLVPINQIARIFGEEAFVACGWETRTGRTDE